MKDTEHLSHGVPLEEYVLTKRDHRDQQTSESISEHAKKEVDKLQAAMKVDPELREGQRRALHKVADIMRIPIPDWQRMRWRVRLYCGHITETTRNIDAESAVAHGASSMRCPECGKDPSRIVAYEPLGRVGELPKPPRPTSPARATRQQLQERVAELEAEVAALKRGLVQD